MEYSLADLDKAIGNVDRKGADELVKEAIDRGVNFFDLNLSSRKTRSSDSTKSPEYPGWMLHVQSAGRLGTTDRPVWDDFQR